MSSVTNASGLHGAGSRLFARDYKIEARVLGTGGSAAVRLASHRRSGAQYAVKVLSTTGLPEAKALQIRREAEIHALLDHPNIVRLQQHYQTKEKSHLVLEQLHGGELFDRLSKEGRLSESAAATAMFQALSALAYMHGLGLAHRDLKLENFVYESIDGEHLKVIDLGCACRFEHGSKMSSYCGTLEYVAPEVFAGAYDEKADVWSLGVMAYMLLCGCTPWSGSDKETYAMIRAGAPSFSAALFEPLSTDAKSFVRSLLTVDPAKRPSAADAMQHPWLRAMCGGRPAVDGAIADNLQRFAQMPPWHRACLALAAGELTDEVGSWARDQFAAVGADHAASISVTDLQHRVAPAAQLASIVMDGGSTIPYSLFLAAVVPEQALFTKVALHFIFDRLDVSQCGRITADDVCTVLGSSFEELDAEGFFPCTICEGLSFDDFCRSFCGGHYTPDTVSKMCDGTRQPEESDLWKAARQIAAGRLGRSRERGGDNVGEQVRAELDCLAGISDGLLCCLGGIPAMLTRSRKSL